MSGLMSADDWEQLSADTADLVDDYGVTITLRRANGVLSPQKVRLGGGGSASLNYGQQTFENNAEFVLLGEKELDIQAGDRFNVAGRLYRVLYVRPDRRYRTVAVVELAE